jgi:hypothetical protein
MSLLSTAGSWINRVGSATPIGKWIGLKHKGPVSRDEALDLRPVRNPVITWDATVRDEDAEVDEARAKTLTLVVPRKSDKMTNFLARMLQAPEEKRIELDEFGSAIWEKCDGSRTVEELARFTSTTYKLNRRQAEVSVMAFMKMLSQRRLIGFMKDGKGSSDVGKSTRQRAAKRRSGERKRRF